MKRLCCTAQFVAALALAGCGTVEVFGKYDLPESPDVADAPWPRLVDTPSAPPPGEYTAAVPNPEDGARMQTKMAAAAVAAETKAKKLAGPVIAPEKKARWARAAERRR